MGKQAYEVLRRFWECQDRGGFAELAQFFADDAVFDDPLAGRFSGRSEIAAFLQRAAVEMAAHQVTFRLVELAGDDEIAWARWEAVSPRGVRPGVGLYRVRDGLLVSYFDLLGPAPRSDRDGDRETEPRSADGSR